MANSIFKKPKTTPRHGHNGFDLSRHRSFTSPVGMLLPVFKDFANPGDKYKLNSREFIRTEALQTAAFVRMKSHVDWFFIPITQLYSRWNEFFNGTNDIMSSIYGTNVSKTLPSVNAGKFIFDPTNKNYNMFITPADGPEYIADDFGIPRAWNFRRLWDMLGYGSLSTAASISGMDFNVSLLDYLAYHKIFHSHYRLTDWTPNDPSVYNVDNYYSTGVIPDAVAAKIMYTIHYRPYRKDFFTNIMPAPVFNNAFSSFISSALQSADLRGLINPEITTQTDVTTRQNSLRAQNPYGGSVSGVVSSGSANLTLNTDSSNVYNISAQDIRATFALDKLLRVTAFAGGHYEQQTLAHFGFKMPEGISNEAYYLGSQKADININEVVATSTTSMSQGSDPKAGSTIGDIAGKAFASTKGEKDISFTAPCHGIIMAIHSIEVLPSYASRGCELQNRKREMFDFYKPELDNVGMQPMFGDFMGLTDIKNPFLTGWTYRYSENKTSFDVVNEGFWATDKSTWVSYKQSIFAGSSSGYTNNYRFYINPQIVNNIFLLGVPYFSANHQMPYYGASQDSSFWITNTKYVNDNPENGIEVLGSSPMSVYASDNFLIDADFKCYKSSIMSVHSMPKDL